MSLRKRFITSTAEFVNHPERNQEMEGLMKTHMEAEELKYTRRRLMETTRNIPQLVFKARQEWLTEVIVIH